MIKYTPPALTLPGFFQDEDGSMYTRLVGGIGWPHGGQPAFAIVLAEGQEELPHYKVIHSFKDHNALKLMESCKGVELTYPVSCWYGNHLNRVMMQLMFEFNKGKEGPDKLKFQGAPLAGEERNSGFYLPLILEMGKVGNKRLTAGASPELYNSLHNITPDTHLNRSIEEFPPLAALSYSISFLLTYKPIKPRVETYESMGRNAWQL